MIEFELCLCWLFIAGWGEGGDERSGPWFGGNKLRLVEDRCSSSSITHWTSNLGPGASGKSGRCGSSPNAGIWAIKGNRLDMARQKLHWAVNVCAGIIYMYSPGPWTVSWYWTILFWQDHSGSSWGERWAVTPGVSVDYQNPSPWERKDMGTRNADLEFGP